MNKIFPNLDMIALFSYSHCKYNKKSCAQICDLFDRTFSFRHAHDREILKYRNFKKSFPFNLDVSSFFSKL